MLLALSFLPSSVLWCLVVAKSLAKLPAVSLSRLGLLATCSTFASAAGLALLPVSLALAVRPSGFDPCETAVASLR
eukprot:6328728-Heterocapsa_arctica.AAC.1